MILGWRRHSPDDNCMKLDPTYLIICDGVLTRARYVRRTDTVENGGKCWLVRKIASHAGKIHLKVRPTTEY